MKLQQKITNRMKVQSNFTTPEQSKRLLELGVPANSADCYYDHFGYKNIRDCELELASNFFDNSIQKYYDKHEGAIPCWSVSRLMEIFAICFDPDFIEFDTFADGTSFLPQMLDKFETYTKLIDFSKLEE